jgi:methylated-DNA-[protein]-cysteine S-methyltransferase
MEIYYAETPVGNVRITCNENAVTQLEFIKNNFSGIPITIPKALQCTFKENQLGKGSPLLPRGTEFQRMVWDALLNVPFGQTVSYGEIAVLLGGKEKARAVGAAVGANPVAILIPCHRALPANGKTGKYRWGADRKKSLLDWETANNEESQFFSAFFKP